MASRLRNRRELRAEAEAAEQVGTAALPVTAPAKPKAKKAPTPRKPRAKKLPPRLRVRWGIFNNSMKQVAIFDYNQRANADAKLAEMLESKKGLHFLQIVKELMEEPASEQAAD